MICMLQASPFSSSTIDSFSLNELWRCTRYSGALQLAKHKITGSLVRNRDTGSGELQEAGILAQPRSVIILGVFHTTFSTTAPEFLSS